MNDFNLLLKLKKNGFPKLNSLPALPAIAVALIASAVSSCKSVDYYEPPTVYNKRGKSVFAPPGMVYVPSGTVVYKSAADGERKVSLSPFFMDATEVTNFQYREFVNWVADSIAVTDILKDEKYFLKPKTQKSKKGSANVATAPGKVIDWSKVRNRGKLPLWQNPDPTIQTKLQEAKLIIEEDGKNVLNKDIVKYGYSFRHSAGPNVDKYLKETVSVIPETDVWANDFPNSQVDIMSENYYQTRSFDHYPVVGVTWVQARAFAHWRGKAHGHLIARNNSLKTYQLSYNLPSEAQWQYAAAGVADPNDTAAVNKNSVLTYKDKKSKKEKLLVNFKQGEGDYTQDGSTFTLPVKTYAPNTFGLYNMNGNVSEWTLDAFSASAIEFVHDLNPVLQYDADENAPAAMKRKVVRGGSWKDSGQSLDIKTRNYELQDKPHSYIGFRCVMPAVEVMTDQVRTRKASELAEGKKGKKSGEPKISKKKSKKESDKAI